MKPNTRPLAHSPWVPRVRIAAEVLAFVLVCTLLTFHFTSNLEYHDLAKHDERQWIYFGEYSFRLAFIERNFEPRAWKKDYFNFGARNPHLGKYLIGAGLYARGYDESDVGTMDHWKRRAGGGWQTVKGKRPTKEVVAAARFPVALTGAGTCLLVFLLGGVLWSRWVGLIALLFLATNEPFRAMSRVVFTDIPEIMLASLALLILLKGTESWKRGRWSALGASALAGVAVGLAMSVKMRSMLALLAVLASYALATAYSYLRARAGAPCMLPSCGWMLVCGSLFALAVVIVFVGLNPYLYHNTMAHLQELLGHGNLDRLQYLITPRPAKVKIPAWETAIFTLGEKLHWFWRLSFVEQGILVREPSRWTGSVWRYGGLVLTALGFASIVRDSIRELCRGERLLRTAFLVWVTVSVLGVLLWTPYRWHRYYLYLFPVWALLAARGFEFLGRRLLMLGSTWIRLGFR